MMTLTSLPKFGLAAQSSASIQPRFSGGGSSNTTAQAIQDYISTVAQQAIKSGNTEGQAFVGNNEFSMTHQETPSIRSEVVSVDPLFDDGKAPQITLLTEQKPAATSHHNHFTVNVQDKTTQPPVNLNYSVKSTEPPEVFMAMNAFFDKVFNQ